jgi:hypothetical protein
MLALCLILVGCPSSTVSVPNVGGLAQVSATTAILGAQLVVGTVTTGTSTTVAWGCVISQNPVAGKKVAPGSAVDMVISTGPAPSLGWTYVPSESSIWGLTVGNTSDGGVIVGGGHNTENDMYALKLTSSGGKDWDKVYSNVSPEEGHPELWPHEARGLLQTDDGGYIMLGAGNNLNDGLPGQSYLFVKTDATGEVVWSNTYAPENPYSPGDYCGPNLPYALDITSDGGYMAVGSSYVGGYNLASILKTDANGDLGFVKVVNDNAKAYDESIVTGQRTSDGGYVLCGYSDNGSPLGHLALLIKLDSDGDLEFSKTYQYPPENHGAEAYAVTQTADGGYVIGGELINEISKVSTYGCWLSKVDANGDVVWIRAYGHAMTIHYPNAIKETPQGDILAAGANNMGAMTLAKFTNSGSLIWNYSLPDGLPTAFANAMTLTDDGGCVMVGSAVTGSTVIAKVNHAFHVD